MNALENSLPVLINTLNKIHEEFANNYGKFIPEMRNNHTRGVSAAENAARFMCFSDVKEDLVQLSKNNCEIHKEMVNIDLQDRKLYAKLERPQTITNEMIAQSARKYSIYYSRILNKISELQSKK